jgi:hypothetical protein
MRRTIITVVAAVALGMAAMTTGAMARGSGGHGGVVAAISAEAAPPTSVAVAAILLAAGAMVADTDVATAVTVAMVVTAGDWACWA